MIEKTFKRSYIRTFIPVYIYYTFYSRRFCVWTDLQDHLSGLRWTHGSVAVVGSTAVNSCCVIIHCGHEQRTVRSQTPAWELNTRPSVIPGEPLATFGLNVIHPFNIFCCFFFFFVNHSFFLRLIKIFAS